MELFTTDSFWYQWRIYRDLIFILKNKDRLDSRLLKEEKPSGLEQYKEKELTYFYRLFRYSLTEGTRYRPRLCVNSLAIKIIRAYPPNNK